MKRTAHFAAGFALLALLLLCGRGSAAPSRTRDDSHPETVTVQSGSLALGALIWRPSGNGPFPAILFNHGSYEQRDSLLEMSQPAVLGPVFARHGYVFLCLFRRGVGLSSGLGEGEGELMARALATQGQEGRNRVQLELLEGEDLREAQAGLACLRALPGVDARRIGVAGHSFGGSLTLLLAERDTTLRAVVTFGAAAGSWSQSAPLRARLRAAVGHIVAPVFLFHATNDYSIQPGKALATDMRRLKKPHVLRIGPVVGQTTRDGHNAVFSSPSTWESEVFLFLDRSLGR